MAACIRSLRIGISGFIKGTTRHKGNTGSRSVIESSSSTTITPYNYHHNYNYNFEDKTTTTTTTTTTPFHSLGYNGLACYYYYPKAKTVGDFEIHNSNNYHINYNHLQPNKSKSSYLCNNHSNLNEEQVRSLTTTQPPPPPHRDKATTTTTTTAADMGVVVCLGSKDEEIQKCDGLGDVENLEGKNGKPNEEQLSHVFNKLADTLPKLFIQPLDYTIYSQKIVFINRIRGIRTEGLFPYVRQVALLRTVGHLRFAYVKFDILKITKHPEEGCVKVRWRINGLTAFKAIVKFWKIKMWNWKSVEEQMVHWYDGFSTFHVGEDGLVHTHIADSMMPDEEHKLLEKESITSKIAALLGLVNRPTSSLNTTTTTTTTATTTTTTAATTTTGAATELFENVTLYLGKLH